MTRRSPSCPFWCAWAVGVGFAIGALLGWITYDGDEGI